MPVVPRCALQCLGACFASVLRSCLAWHVQAVWRGQLARSRTQRLRAAITVQALRRGRRARRRLAAHQAAATAVQAAWRGAHQRQAYLRARTAAVQVPGTCNFLLRGVDCDRNRWHSCCDLNFASMVFDTKCCAWCRSRRQCACAALAPCSGGSAPQPLLCRQPGGLRSLGVPHARLSQHSTRLPWLFRQLGGAAGSVAAS